ncbi:MAG: penicillin-binding protein 2 [Elusimicrobiaceae bacterium]|nr:penicillin-binding protein 2 [Elusimicrobiaceae bacterium]
MKTKLNFNVHRLMFMFVLALLCGALIAYKLIFIQFISHQKYTSQAEKNRTQILYQTAPRGQILASGGEVLASNQAAFSLYYLPPFEMPDEKTLTEIADAVSKNTFKSQKDILQIINKSLKNGKAALLVDNLAPKNIFALAELQNFYPGLYLLEETKRYYPFGASAAHLLGYIGTMEKNTWKELSGELDYRLNSKIGKSGIEKRYEKELKGRDGGLFLEVNYKGRVTQIIKDNRWRKGADVYTTLLAPVQQAAEDAVRTSLTGRGAAVVLDVKTGAVLALASLPDWDPNIFTPYNTGKNNEDKIKISEYNLAVQGLFPPASTFKTITALAAYENGYLDLKHEDNCTGHIYLNGREFKCWKNHGPHIDFIKGMEQSCDTYFYNLGLKMGSYNIEKMQRKFHFGRKTGIDLPGEKSGNIYGPTKRANLKTYWFGGDTLNLSIGQGELLLTPIQMAVYAAALASKGKIWKPYYIEKVVSPSGKILEEGKSELVDQVKLKDGAFEIIHKALKSVVDNATGRGAKIKDIAVYGKTGTAQNPHGDDHGWFLAFAGEEDGEPEIAVSVLIQFGKGGGAQAAPAARKIIKAYFDLKHSKEEGNKNVQ